MRIRDVTPDDAARLLAFRKALFAETEFLLYGPDDYALTVAEIAAQIERMSRDAASRSLIAENESGFVGFLSIFGSGVPRVRHAALLALGVLRAWWGQGVAADLMNEALRWAPTAGISRLELSVMATNSRAMAFYERLGFKIEGTRRRAYIIDGKPVDDHIMWYIFDAHPR